MRLVDYELWHTILETFCESEGEAHLVLDVHPKKKKTIINGTPQPKTMTFEVSLCIFVLPFCTRGLLFLIKDFHFNFLGKPSWIYGTARNDCMSISKSLLQTSGGKTFSVKVQWWDSRRVMPQWLLRPCVSTFGIHCNVEEILHHLGCINLVNSGINYIPLNWLTRFQPSIALQDISWIPGTLKAPNINHRFCAT